jgi:hypothetical protein
MILEEIADKLPWRLQSQINFRPKKANTKHITEVLSSTQDKLPLNKYKLVANGYESDLKQPKKFLNNYEHPSFLENHKLPVEPIYFASLKKGRFCQFNNIPTIINSSNIIIDGAQRHPFYYNPFKDDYTHPLLSCAKMQKSKKLKGNVLFLGTDGAHNGYFHVMGRMVPKLGVLAELGIDPNFFDWIIINGEEKEYKTAPLVAAGVQKGKLIFAKESEHFEADYLFFIPRARYHSIGLDYMKETFCSNLPDVKGENLYIGRSDAKFRKLIDEESLVKKISNYNFSPTSLAELPFVDQVAKFHDANITLGIHGAGLTNMIFSKENSYVIEILDKDYVNINYWFFANLLNINYIPIIGESVVIAPEKNPNMRSNVLLNQELQDKLYSTIESIQNNS